MAVERIVAQHGRDSSADIEASWRQTLTQGHALKRFASRTFRILPSPPRCKVCHSPFGGVGGRLFRLIGMAPSRKNPRICALCCEHMPAGGAEVEAVILFADVRGSTALAEQIGPTEYAAKLNRFYGAATEVLVRHEATVDKLIGDEVMAFFVPGFAGPAFRRSAIEAGQAVLRALGYGSGQEGWLPVGIGIDAGTAYVGNVGGEGFLDFTALGDPVNIAARIQSAARPGELLVGEAAFAAVAERYPDCKSRLIRAKGKGKAIRVYSVPLA